MRVGCKARDRALPGAGGGQVAAGARHSHLGTSAYGRMRHTILGAVGVCVHVVMAPAAAVEGALHRGMFQSKQPSTLNTDATVYMVCKGLTASCAYVL